MAGDPGTELAVKTLTEDSTLYHFGNYLSKIGKHVALDLGEALDWATEKLRGETLDDQDAAEQGAGCAAPADRGANAFGGERAMIAQKKKILILMSDTGGGHRASANAIKAALLSLEPEQLEVKIVDVLEDYTLWFSNRLYTWYIKYPVRLAVLVHALVFFHTHTHTHTRTHTHAHTHTHANLSHIHAPQVVWETIYKTTKWTAGKPWPLDFVAPSMPGTWTVQSGFRRCIAAEQPDLVISVHPILQCIPLASFMPKKPPRPIPFLTCVTDLGDGHPWWFNPAADRLFVPSASMRAMALRQGVVYTCTLNPKP